MSGMFQHLSQMYPPKPGFTEEHIPELHGNVYIVTGANTGLGKEIARILYSKHATVYILARSREKASQAIDDIRKSVPDSTGELIYVYLDLADLSTIKASVQQILDTTKKIHVIFNNAGVMLPPEGQKSAQGYDLQLGVNNIGTHLFTKLLTPTLVETAKTEPTGTVRVVWVASSAGELATTAFTGGVPLDNLDYHKKVTNMTRYGISKAGNYLQGVELARRYKADGIVSVPLNPGNLNSDLWRSLSSISSLVVRTMFLYPVIYGAYTQLFAAFSPDVTLEKSGNWVVPWGRFMDIRKDMKDAAKSEEEGGNGVAKKFWEWLDEQVKQYE